MLRLLASREVRDTRTQEETAIDAEDFWTQAEEACAVDPISVLVFTLLVKEAALGVT